MDFEIGFKKLWPGTQRPGFNYSSHQPYTLSWEVGGGIVTRQGSQNRGIRHLTRMLPMCDGDRKEEGGAVDADLGTWDAEYAKGGTNFSELLKGRVLC